MGSLKVFAPEAQRRPRILAALQQSFAPLESDEIPDFHGYRPTAATRKMYELSELERDKAQVGLALGYVVSHIMRMMFSPKPDNLLMLDSISEDKRHAAKLYLDYLRRNKVKVGDVRRGMTGLLRNQAISACTQIAAYHKTRP
jgi:hypothetical protein